MKRTCMYLVISILVLRAGYGIWLHQFLIIAFFLFGITQVFNAAYQVPDIVSYLVMKKNMQFVFVCRDAPLMS